MKPASFLNCLQRLILGESGSMTIFGLFLFVAMLIVGGMAADYSNAVRIQAHLRAAGDAAAHAALIEREFKSPDEARATAIKIAQRAIPAQLYGNAIQPSDIKFGYWDPSTKKFTVDENSRDAVLVDTARASERANSVTTFFLGLIGINKWNINRQSVFETYIPVCLAEGMVADVGIEIQSGNVFMAPFCLHSNDWMDFANGNTFHDGSHVTIPDISKLSADYGTNSGLSEALDKGDDRVLRIVNRIADIYDGIQTPGSRYYRSYITSSLPVELESNDGMTEALWQEGRIHRVICTKKNESITFDSAITLKNGVLVTNCILKVNGVTLEDATLITLNVAPDSINSPSGLTLGRKDNCTAGGGAQILTMGGVSVSSKMSFHNGQIIAAGDVKFTSHADGSWGASIVSGGTIDASSHNKMRTCAGVGMEDNFNAAYFRLAY